MSSLNVETTDAEIRYPYLVLSDIHLHPWSQFSCTLADGRNNRLQHILDAIDEAVKTLAAKGGRDIIITGDLFHTRGNVKPSVLNPTVDLFKSICAHGMKVHSIPGNHDLEGINSDTLGNSMHSLTMLSNFTCYTVPTQTLSNHLFVPWYEDSQKVLKLANERSKLNPKLTLFAHVGLNGVVPANIGNTLNPTDFDEGLKYVFCGHFHNHVSFNSRVFSVGALTHQTWSDVGSKAGYLIVHEDKVEHFETKAPKFLEDNDAKNPVKGNYVRIRDEMTEEGAKLTVKLFKDEGALGVIDQSKRPSIVAKDYSHTVKVDLGLDVALEAYCKHTFGDNWQKVYDECVKLRNKT